VNVLASVTVLPKRPARLVGEVLRAMLVVVRRLSWRVVGITLAIMAALDVWFVYELRVDSTQQPPESYVSGAIINLLMAFSIMFATLVAEELVSRGARRFGAYAWAVVFGSAAAAMIQWQVHGWLHLHTRYDVSSPETAMLQPPLIFFEYLIWGSIIVFIYVSHRTALLATARMNAARVRRADAQRRTLESRLQALQARVEPRFLFNTLAQVHALYESDPAKGAQMLGDLIVYLRAALPQLRDSTSTLERELRLVRAYLSIIQVRFGGRLGIDDVVPLSVYSGRLPPMILLPLLEQGLNRASSSSGDRCTIRIAAHISTGKLRIEIAFIGDAFGTGGRAPDLGDIQERLHSLYGEAGNITFGSAGDGMQAVIEIPYEPTDGRHR
jgi:hypothetical protein